MADDTRANYLKHGTGNAEATRTTGTNPDGSPYSGARVKMTGAANLATGQVTVGAVLIEIVPARATRRSVTLRNMDAANTLFIVAGDDGFPLFARESVSIDTTAAISGQRETSDVLAAYLETYD